jgi:cytochrome c-L
MFGTLTFRAVIKRAAFSVGAALVIATAAAAGAIEFKNALDDSPLDVGPIAGEQFTDAVKSFHETGKNAYKGNAEAAAKGKEMYDEMCAACHNPDGSGHMGPSFLDEVVSSPRANTEVGMFEVIHSGSSGAMRSFAQRGVTQDQILQIMAYIEELKSKQ